MRTEALGNSLVLGVSTAQGKPASNFCRKGGKKVTEKPLDLYERGSLPFTTRAKGGDYGQVRVLENRESKVGMMGEEGSFSFI